MKDNEIIELVKAIVSDNDCPELLEQIDTVRDALKGKKQTNFGGFYMETPYMNPKFKKIFNTLQPMVISIE